MISRRDALCLMGSTLLLGACTKAETAAPLGGTLEILGPERAFSAAIGTRTLPADWLLQGAVPAGGLKIGVVDGINALRIAPQGRNFALYRRTRASLLAMPYLSWSWNARPPAEGDHPVRVVVGLGDRARDDERSWWQIGGDDEPKIHRMIAVSWQETALARGSLIGPARAEGRPETATYIARGGPEQGKRWWADTVDLSLIHSQIWPGDVPGNMEIRLVGFAARSGPADAVMSLAAMRLHR